MKKLLLLAWVASVFTFSTTSKADELIAANAFDVLLNKIEHKVDYDFCASYSVRFKECGFDEDSRIDNHTGGEFVVTRTCVSSKPLSDFESKLLFSFQYAPSTTPHATDSKNLNTGYSFRMKNCKIAVEEGFVTISSDPILLLNLVNELTKNAQQNARYFSKLNDENEPVTFQFTLKRNTNL